MDWPYDFYPVGPHPFSFWEFGAVLSNVEMTSDLLI
jgi:hypothetical protein